MDINKHHTFAGMNFGSKIILLVFVLGCIFTSCEKKRCDDPIPKMTFKNFVPSEVDTGYYLLTFEFSDCDGDLGLADGQRILDENGEEQINNLFLDFYYVDNNQWVKYDFDSAVGLDYRMPELSNSNQDPSLEGEIEQKLHPIFSLAGYDSVMFKSRILDNAGNYSNWVETPGYVIVF
ncbi:MAG: hypothetical protein ACPGRC_04580 [Salibacteraceae bacterium]